MRLTVAAITRVSSPLTQRTPSHQQDHPRRFLLFLLLLLLLLSLFCFPCTIGFFTGSLFVMCPEQRVCCGGNLPCEAFGVIFLWCFEVLYLVILFVHLWSDNLALSLS